MSAGGQIGLGTTMRGRSLTTRHWAFALTLGLMLSACDGGREQASGDPADPLVNTQRQSSDETQSRGWGPLLLGLVPERGDQSAPSLARVRDALKDCGQPSGEAGRCDLLGRGPALPGAPSVSFEIDSTSGDALAIRLSACCSADPDFFRPIGDEAVILTELICSELTIVSSETVKAFRVSSPGKRDFIFARGSRTTPTGGRVDLTMMLSPVEQIDECPSLAAAHAKFVS